MNKIIDYCHAVDVHEVKRLLAEGWQPLGGPCFLLPKGMIQAMVRYEEPRPAMLGGLDWQREQERIVEEQAQLQSGLNLSTGTQRARTTEVTLTADALHEPRAQQP